MTATARPVPLLQRLIKKGGKHFLRWAGGFQARHSLVSTTPVIANTEFSWVTKLEQAYTDIRIELDSLLEHPEDIPAFHQLSPDQKRISRGDNWKTYAFYVYGQRVDDNCALCPRTAAVLDSLPGMKTAMFSILAPHYHIPPHKGPTRAVIRAHLALKVPTDWQKVWIRVDDKILNWKEGEVMLFDDTYEHEVRNDTDETRAVLFIDIDRPMDGIGTLFNRLIIRLIQASSYVKQPLKNLTAWNREHPH
ncbi:MAG TPA: aspartyl/asparaginyl beta-hydroxylase domain-containing protein [Gammaproteobacteria bacterium]|nr:aspartyl/asparaginyl beta-hydroxylase domain-containing protein [Gammaproteobacteria bacterium]